VLEAVRDVGVDRQIVRPPRWIGTEAAHLLDGILKDVDGSWNAEINGYQFWTAAVNRGTASSLTDSGGDSETSGKSPSNV
jgi:hypothetical protein